jgi:hypothetical protein
MDDAVEPLPGGTAADIRIFPKGHLAKEQMTKREKKTVKKPGYAGEGPAR